MRFIVEQVFTFEELTEEAQTRAVENVRELLAGAWWDQYDTDAIREEIVYTLAERLGARPAMTATGRVTSRASTASRSTDGTSTGAGRST